MEETPDFDQIEEQQERNAWDRLDGEPVMWYDRFLDYLHQHPKRSLLKLANQHKMKNPDEGYAGTPGSWSRASKQWDWDARAAAYDAHLIEEKKRKFDEERREVLSEGFANMHKRVAALNSLATKLLDIIETDGLWDEISKVAGPHKGAQIIKDRAFRAALVSEFRKTLEDIAAEVGERQRSDIAVNTNVQTFLVMPVEEGDESE